MDSGFPQLRDREWLKLRYSDRSLRAIAAELGCSRWTVERALDAHGIPRRPKHIPIHAKGRAPVVQVGETYGHLTVPAASTSTHQREYVARCICGTEVVASGSAMKTGRKRSCGCRNQQSGSKPVFLQLRDVAWLTKRYATEGATIVEIAAEVGCSTGAVFKALRRAEITSRPFGQHQITHGHAIGSNGSATYRIWLGMRGRCRNPNNTRFSHYGGRGITVCDRWEPTRGGSFENFLADMGERPEGKSIDRIDNDGNYEPGNCRWATQSEQVKNQRRFQKTA
jgi:AraC-like DNA-binding protein